MSELALPRAVAAGLVSAAIVSVVIPRLAPGSDLSAYLGALALLGTALLVLLARRLPGPHARARPDTSTSAVMRLPPLTRLARLCDAAGRDVDDTHHRLRSRLVRVAEDVLTAHSIDLHDPTAAERARRLLGDEAWAWVRPPHQGPSHPGHSQPGQAAPPGPDLAALERVVDALERLEVPRR